MIPVPYKDGVHWQVYKQYENQITLPLHSRLTNEEAEYVAKSFVEIVNKYAK